MFQLDVNFFFLYGDLHEKVCMEQPLVLLLIGDYILQTQVVIYGQAEYLSLIWKVFHWNC